MNLDCLRSLNKLQVSLQDPLEMLYDVKCFIKRICVAIHLKKKKHEHDQSWFHL